MDSVKTIRPKPQDIKREYWIIDAKDMVLGRLAAKCASILRGKHKPIYQPDVDCGDFVIVINSKLVKTTGNKLRDKVYQFHTNHPGGLKEKSLGFMLENNPNQVIMLAVKRMLPKNRLGHRILKRLKVYETDKHPHIAQNPKPLK
jgi:large subunit ribosomal protein L13